MKTRVTRRTLLQTAGVAALATPATTASAATIPGPRFEGKDTPKIGLAVGDGGGPLPAPAPGAEGARGGRGGGGFGGNAEVSCKRLKQIGVYWARSGGPPIPRY